MSYQKKKKSVRRMFESNKPVLANLLWLAFGHFATAGA